MIIIIIAITITIMIIIYLSGDSGEVLARFKTLQ